MCVCMCVIAYRRQKLEKSRLEVSDRLSRSLLRWGMHVNLGVMWCGVVLSVVLMCAVGALTMD